MQGSHWNTYSPAHQIQYCPDVIHSSIATRQPPCLQLSFLHHQEKTIFQVLESGPWWTQGPPSSHCVFLLQKPSGFIQLRAIVISSWKLWISPVHYLSWWHLSTRFRRTVAFHCLLPHLKLSHTIFIKILFYSLYTSLCIGWFFIYFFAQSSTLNFII